MHRYKAFSSYRSNRLNYLITGIKKINRMRIMVILAVFTDIVSRPLRNTPFCPISVLGSNFIPRNITYIPAVKIFAFLEFEQISTDFEIEHFSEVSFL